MNKVALYYLENNQNISKTDISSVVAKIEKMGIEVTQVTDVQIKVLSDHQLMITLGGDGTILRASMVALQYGLPLLGISKGNLGFLAEVQSKDIRKALEDYTQEAYFFDERHLLQMTYQKSQQLALNEITIKNNGIKMIELEVYLNDMYLTTYKADGLILSTSTGSTAYNLSAGGPIIFPDTKAIIITPICSHSLTVRSLVVSSGDTIKIIPKGKDNWFSIDGNEPVHFSNKQISISYSDEFINFVRFSKHTFIDGLRNKLNWSGKL
ncbi:MAG: hypothetical protein A2Y40_03975 [Candidatus Margulisbacteria bacterium GWF2_35_9]|nr:MAG: hypothetical protein A2Y40_03975 [Candidatus Margulisbacteria bacterium GWF2_35_9]